MRNTSTKLGTHMKHAKKVEYKLVPSSGLPTEEQLNELANEGWEVLQIVPNTTSRDRYEYVVYLKRQRHAATKH
jgi:hypothetical protein